MDATTKLILECTFPEVPLQVLEDFELVNYTDCYYWNLLVAIDSKYKHVKSYAKLRKVLLDSATKVEPLWMVKLANPTKDFLTGPYLEFCNTVDSLRLICETPEDRHKFNAKLLACAIEPTTLTLNRFKAFILNYLSEGKHFKGNIKNEGAVIGNYLNDITRALVTYQNAYKDYSVKVMDTEDAKKEVQKNIAAEAIDLSVATGVAFETALIALMFVYSLIVFLPDHCSDLTYFTKGNERDFLDFVSEYLDVYNELRRLLSSAEPIESAEAIPEAEVSTEVEQKSNVPSGSKKARPALSNKEIVNKLDFSGLLNAEDLKEFKASLNYLVKSNFVLSPIVNSALAGSLKPIVTKNGSFILLPEKTGPKVMLKSDAIDGAYVYSCNITKRAYITNDSLQVYPVLCEGSIKALERMSNQGRGLNDNIGCYVLGILCGFNSCTVFLSEKEVPNLYTLSGYKQASASLVKAVKMCLVNYLDDGIIRVVKK